MTNPNDGIPTWLNRELYPFESRFMDVPDGRLHYVDEGEGDVILMVHGTPTWSFLYRHLIIGLRDNYRVIAPDMLGFGLSENPRHYSYKIKDQARNLQAFIDTLDLRDIILVVHDFGGATGLAHAINHPDNVKRLILFNTWMWSLKSDLQMRLVGGLLGSPIGRFLYKRLDFEFNVVMPSFMGNWSQLSDDVKNHYKRPLDTQFAKTIAWLYASELLGAADWYESLWAQRDAIKDIPALLLWGMQDTAFGAPRLTNWQALFTNADIHRFDDANHFLQEEMGATLLPYIMTFLDE